MFVTLINSSNGIFYNKNKASGKCLSSLRDELVSRLSGAVFFMKKTDDLRGYKLGRLTVGNYAEYRGKGEIVWECFCECGAVKMIFATSLINGTKSCGCLQKEAVSARSKTHGLSKTNEYRILMGMKARCYNQNDAGYQNYGGRGITVCDRWLHSFENFFADMGKRPSPKHSIDRINNDGNYEPSNCRWATKNEQCNNTRVNNIISYKGETKTLSEWSIKLGIKRGTLQSRIYAQKYSIEKAFELPVKRKSL